MLLGEWVPAFAGTTLCIRSEESYFIGQIASATAACGG